MKAKTTYIAIGAGVLIIALAVFYTYSADQAKNRGKSFGDSLQTIQDEVEQIQTEFYSKKTLLDEKSITQQEFLEFGKTHIEKLNQILAKYDSLSPPQSFAKSVELFKTSTQKQIESDQYLLKWIATNDTSDKIRSDSLFQESFEHEIAGLESYNRAKNNAGQN